MVEMPNDQRKAAVAVLEAILEAMTNDEMKTSQVLLEIICSIELQKTACAQTCQSVDLIFWQECIFHNVSSKQSKRRFNRKF